MIDLKQHIADSLQQWRLVQIVRPFTLVSSTRIKNLYRLARETETQMIPGDFVECGVYNGGTGAILAHVASHARSDRTVWLLDSFRGMPQTTIEDTKSAAAYVGQVVGSVDMVRSILRRVGADMARIRIVEGWFQETFPTVSIPSVALLNIDADWYESVKLCLETFYDVVAPGGFISVDDYGHWPGCKQAVDEFLRARNLQPVLHVVDYTARWFQKP